MTTAANNDSPTIAAAITNVPNTSSAATYRWIGLRAVRLRLLEIGEGVKALPEDLLASEPNTTWRQIAAMRDDLAHRYFNTSHTIVLPTADHHLPDSHHASRQS